MESDNMGKIEELALEHGVTAGEVNALLTNAERAEVNGAGAPIASNAQQLEAAAPVSPVAAISDTERDATIAEGKETANEIENARNASDTVARTVLLARAEQYVGKVAHATVFLSGFEMGLKECGLTDGIVKSRKSEAKAVIEAYAKTIAENLAEAREKMEAFTGGYHAFITLCREVRKIGATTPTQAPGDKGRKARLSDSEDVRARALLRSMSNGQATEAAVIIGSHIRSMPDGELAMVRLVANVYLSQLAMSKDAGIVKWATDSRERALVILAAADKAAGKDTASDHTGHGIISMPSPVIVEKLAA